MSLQSPYSVTSRGIHHLAIGLQDKSIVGLENAKALATETQHRTLDMSHVAPSRSELWPLMVVLSIAHSSAEFW